MSNDERKGFGRAILAMVGAFIVAMVAWTVLTGAEVPEFHGPDPGGTTEKRSQEVVAACARLRVMNASDPEEVKSVVLPMKDVDWPGREAARELNEQVNAYLTNDSERQLRRLEAAMAATRTKCNEYSN